MRILITGGCGTCGTALVGLQHDSVFLDRVQHVPGLNGREFIQGDISDTPQLAEAMRGCDAVVHLAIALPDGGKSWDDLLAINTALLHQVLSTAMQHKVGRVVYASSNHVVGMYEIENAPEIYGIGQGLIIDRDTPVRPDSLYAVGKVFGETLGRFHAEHGGPRFYAIRIGSVLAADCDHPYAAAERGVKEGRWGRDSDAYRRCVERFKGSWLSRRDFAHLVDCCLRYDGPRFDIFYGVSDNARRWMDIEHAKQSLGYRPLDNGEQWTGPGQRLEQVV